MRPGVFFLERVQRLRTRVFCCDEQCMRRMTKCLLMLLVFGLCCSALSQLAQLPTISIQPMKPAFESGQPIQVHIVLENTTDREFTVFRSTGGASGEQYYSVRVIGPDGNSPAPTEYGAAMEKNRDQIVPLSRKMVPLAPGAFVDDNVTISRMFDMAAAGTYVVQVSRPSPFDRSIILKSNTLAIKVDNE